VKRFDRLFVLVACAIAAAAPAARAEPAPVPVRWHTLLATGSFDDDHFFFGLAYRIRVLREANVGIQPFASFRPQDNRTLEPVRPHFYIQRNESYRAIYGVTADGIHMLGSHVGAFAGLGASYSHGNYAGTRENPGSGWSWVLETGGTMFLGSAPSRFVARVGYRRVERFLSGDHMAYLALGAEL